MALDSRMRPSLVLHLAQMLGARLLLAPCQSGAPVIVADFYDEIGPTQAFPARHSADSSSLPSPAIRFEPVIKGT